MKQLLKHMKSMALSMVLISTLLASAAHATPQREGIAAIVGEDLVTYSDVRNRLRMVLTTTKVPNDPKVLKRLETQVLDSLINESLQMQEAAKIGIEVKPEQFEGALARLAQQNKTTAERLKIELEARDVPFSTLAAQINAQIAWGHVVRRRLRPRINISESEIDAVLDDMERNAGKPEFLVAEIFLTIPHPNKEREIANTASDLMNQLQQGKPFSRLAKEFSQSAGSERGGDLGWVRIGQLDPKLENALRQMRPGQVSPPIRTTTGVHILYMRDVRIQPPLKPSKSAEQKKAEAAAKAKAEEEKIAAEKAAAKAAEAAKAPKTIRDYHADIKQIFIPTSADEPETIKKAKVARAYTLANEIKSCSDMQARYPEFSSPATGDLGVIPVSKLPNSVIGAIQDLPDQTLSQPLINNRGIFVLMICNRHIPGAANEMMAEAQKAPVAKVESTNLEAPSDENMLPSRDDQAFREQIAGQLGMERLDILQERYMRDLRAAAHIEKRI